MPITSDMWSSILIESVTVEQVERALKYLADTDVNHAAAKCLAKGLDAQLKTIRAVEFMGATGNNAEREHQAYASQAYKDALTRWQDACLEYETMQNKRERACLTVEMFRTLEASRRVGNIR